jgi:hypothetical protein
VTNHTDHNLEKYRADIAKWEAVREHGFVRYVLVRGVLQRGVPVFLVLTAVAAVIQFGLKVNDRLITSWEGPAAFLGMGIFLGARRAMIEWNLREKEYLAWRTYEGGGNVLGLGE